MSSPVIFRVAERPFPQVPQGCENTVANGDVFAICPESPGDSEDQVWVYAGQDREGSYADYEACMAASREATPAECAALMEELGPILGGIQPCGHRTEEMRDAAYGITLMREIMGVYRIILEVDPPTRLNDLSGDWLEEVVVDISDLMVVAKRHVERRAATGEDPAVRLPTGRRAIDVRNDEERRSG